MKQIYLSAIILIGLAVGGNAVACEIKVNGLPEAEVARLEQACKDAQAKVLADAAVEATKQTEKSSDPEPTPKPTPEPKQKTETAIAGLPSPNEVTPYGRVALEVAGAIGVAAKELGMAINDFLWTPAGILTVTIVIGKLFGMQFLGLLFCFLVMKAGYSFVRRVLICSYEEKQVTILWGLMSYTKKVPVFCAWKEVNESQGATIVMVTLATVVLVWAFLYNMVM